MPRDFLKSLCASENVIAAMNSTVDDAIAADAIIVLSKDMHSLVKKVKNESEMGVTINLTNNFYGNGSTHLDNSKHIHINQEKDE